MSAGPIRQERQAHAAPLVSTSAKDRVCAPGTAAGRTLGRSYCGRSKATRATSWVAVTCADCRAARAADEAVG
ncbi:hypothetical protein [Microbacterium sp. MMO-56]|uniref:hypothetical protein n=1 Tax=Microbacterium sp. MMO-56 TaxID=3081281 RepID=UPI003015AA99